MVDSKSIFGSNLIGQKGIMISFSTSNFMAGSLKVLPLLCSCKGAFPESTCLRISAAQEKYAVGSYSYRYNGSHVTNSSTLFSEKRVLESYDDEYGGVIVNADKLPFNTNVFASMLRSSLLDWRNKGKKGVWLKLPLEKCDLVPIAVKEGFQYHHAERGYVMMTFWIPNGPCMLPANASHQVGVGGFVMNDKNEVLVVQEKHCAPELAGLWKLPTGFVLESEEIFTAAVREVREETGVDTEFMEVIAFRHAHNVAFEKSDLFFICMLRPVSSEIRVDDLEVQSAKWMPLVEFVEQPLIKGDKMFKKIIDICIARLGKRYCGLSVHKVVSKFDNRLSTLYYNIVDGQPADCSDDSCASSYT